MRTAALIVLGLAAAYLLAIGVVAIVRPATAYRFFRQFAQTVRANLIEMACRFAVGSAFLVVADTSPAPAACRLLGIVLIASAFILTLMPALHRQFANRVMPGVERAMPVMGVVALLMGGALVAFTARLIFAPPSPY